ncbi:MAG: aminoglycoside phosphotransferase family protein [Patescibacteria group bacterium]
MSRIELSGGFINHVYREDGTVEKVYDHDEMVGVSSIRRLRNEAKALKFFGGGLAPKLIEIGPGFIIQEFINGETYEVRARRGENIFFEVGQILRQIHKPVRFREEVLKTYYERRINKVLSATCEMLDFVCLVPRISLCWQEVFSLGATCLHRDYWLGNIVGNEGKPKVIDWEFAGVGSPYEDFAIVDLWIIREFKNSQLFWQGYGLDPDRDTLNAFLGLKCLEFLATTSVSSYKLESDDGFYHNKVNILKNIWK